jgi:hypothetical protein
MWDFKFSRRRVSSGMMDAVRISETPVDNHFTRQYIPEDNSEHHWASKFLGRTDNSKLRGENTRIVSDLFKCTRLDKMRNDDNNLHIFRQQIMWITTRRYELIVCKGRVLITVTYVRIFSGLPDFILYWIKLSLIPDCKKSVNSTNWGIFNIGYLTIILCKIQQLNTAVLSILFCCVKFNSCHLCLHSIFFFKIYTNQIVSIIIYIYIYIYIYICIDTKSEKM